jgi:hypothetical protein
LRSLQFHNARYQKVSPHDDQTCGWLQDIQQYRDWNSSKESSLLLIEGKPGSGKSTLVRYFNDHLLRLEDDDIAAKFFYSHRDGELERNHNSMFRCLLHDILTADESFFIHFQEAYRGLQDLEIPHKPRDWTHQALKNVLRCCTKHPLRRRLYLVVDAMDESDDCNRGEIVEFLWSLSDPSSNGCVVKIFLASRPINELHPDLMHRCNTILLQNRNRNDIENYTQAFLNTPRFSCMHTIKEEVMKYIVENADGVFLWVHLVTNELLRFVKNGARPTKVFEYLKSLPTDLESYYVYMFNKLCGDEDDLRDGTRILQFCLFSHRPIGLMEIHHALAIPGGPQEYEPNPTCWEREKPMDIERLLIHSTGYFLEIKRNTTSQPAGTRSLFISS